MNIRGFKIPLTTILLLAIGLIWPTIDFLLEKIIFLVLAVPTTCSDSGLSGLPSCDKEMEYDHLRWLLLPQLHLWILILALVILVLSNRQWLSKAPVQGVSFNTRVSLLLPGITIFLLYLIWQFERQIDIVWIILILAILWIINTILLVQAIWHNIRERNSIERRLLITGVILWLPATLAVIYQFLGILAYSH